MSELLRLVSVRRWYTDCTRRRLGTCSKHVLEEVGRRLRLVRERLSERERHQHDGQYEYRHDIGAIEVGRQADGYYEVRTGLQEGEKVSTAANFLIDSESKLKAAVQGK